MFNEIHNKIKFLAQILLYCSIAAAITFLFVFFNTANDYGASYAMIWLVFAIATPIAGYITSIFIYGFGVMIEKLTNIEENQYEE